MIQVTKLNEAVFYINSDLIEYIESTPDTTISMTTGRKVIVKESVPEVISRVVGFKKAVFYCPERTP